MESPSDPEGSRSKRNSIGQDVSSESALARVQLEACFQNHYPALAQMLRPYVLSMELATTRDGAERIAHEILIEAYREVQKHPQNYDITRSAKAWIVGFALNLLRRRRREEIRRARREVSLSSDIAAGLVGEIDEELKAGMSDRYILRLLIRGAASAAFEPEESLLRHQSEGDLALQMKRLLDVIPVLDPLDQGTLRAALHTNFDCSATARLLGIRPGAARTRLHRAIRRLRVAYFRAHPLRETE